MNKNKVYQITTGLFPSYLRYSWSVGFWEHWVRIPEADREVFEGYYTTSEALELI